MYQANQRAVMQTANMALINIRTAEVQYFSTFFSDFATQASIVAGAIVGAVSQTPGYQNSAAYIFKFSYFTFSAAALIVSLQCLLTTLIASAYGQGMALRGPLGSMVQAIDAMVYEQQQIVVSFIWAIVFFEVQTAAMYMLVMTTECGVVSFAICMIGGFITWHYALRIYNRFHYDIGKDAWEGDSAGMIDPEAALDALDPDSEAAVPNNSYSRGANSRSRSRRDNSYNSGSHSGSTIADDEIPRYRSESAYYHNSLNSSAGEVRNRRTILSRLAGSANSPRKNNADAASAGGSVHDPFNEFSESETPYVQMSEYGGGSVKGGTVVGGTSVKGGSTISALHSSASRSGRSSANIPIGGPATSSLSEGYLTIKSARRLTMDPWERRYVVLKGKNIFYFASKRAFENHPGEPINARPISLEGYWLVAGANEPPYAISLVPRDPDDIRKTWKFRCDTLGEFNAWIDRFDAALKACNPVTVGSTDGVSGSYMENMLVKLPGAQIVD